MAEKQTKRKCVDPAEFSRRVAAMDAAEFGLLSARQIRANPYSQNWALVASALESGVGWQPEFDEIQDLIERLSK